MKKWTDEELKILEDGYKQRKNLSDIANQLGRNYGTVASKASMIGLTKKYPRLENLIGQQFGRLTVICQLPHKTKKNGIKVGMWGCKCSCGNPNLIEVQDDNLKSGDTISCGCYKSEIISKRRHILNIYEDNDSYMIGYTFKHEPFYFDKEDFDIIKDYVWYKNDQGYIMTNIMNEDGSYRRVRFHRLVMEKYYDIKDLDIDHIGGINTRNDNRKKNLRVVDHSENMANVPLKTNNTSGVTGVYWVKNIGLWNAKISFHNINYDLGYFSDFDKAVAARKAAEEKYFKEYSYDNSMKIYNDNSLLNYEHKDEYDNG